MHTLAVAPHAPRDADYDCASSGTPAATTSPFQPQRAIATTAYVHRHSRLGSPSHPRAASGPREVPSPEPQLPSQEGDYFARGLPFPPCLSKLQRRAQATAGSGRAYCSRPRSCLRA
ncbi:hypothetical protein K466DRAFT_658138 [Polyporus arcularius HHB13444]|uniref:Uncharacterized protein n=1 Tax=Polyporus arcularius HHB13444 TaxID=1314778 RepID=A0A5C3Q0W6_9APHY|nr:hypothetical protein K466DRAFT_658138 [Polyporus arcularius HHB13444]